MKIHQWETKKDVRSAMSFIIEREEVSAATEAFKGIQGNEATLLRQRGASRKTTFKDI